MKNKTKIGLRFRFTNLKLYVIIEKSFSCFMKKIFIIKQQDALSTKYVRSMLHGITMKSVKKPSTPFKQILYYCGCLKYMLTKNTI